VVGGLVVSPEEVSPEVPTVLRDLVVVVVPGERMALVERMGPPAPVSPGPAVMALPQLVGVLQTFQDPQQYTELKPPLSMSQ